MVQEIEQDESPALLAWLQKIEPLVHKHLSQGSRSHAFDGKGCHSPHYVKQRPFMIEEDCLFAHFFNMDLVGSGYPPSTREVRRKGHPTHQGKKYQKNIKK